MKALKHLQQSPHLLRFLTRNQKLLSFTVCSCLHNHNMSIGGDFCVSVHRCGMDLRSASGATACEASGRWCVLHVNHQMFLKRATGGGGGGSRAATAGRVG